MRRGSLVEAKLSADAERSLKKGHRRWRLVISIGRDANGKWKQKWSSFTGTRVQAEAKLRELVAEVERGEYVEPSKMTVGEWLDEWLEKVVKPPRVALNTYKAYKAAIDAHIKPALGTYTLQRLASIHIAQYYTQSALSQRTLMLHHAILTSALKAAENESYVRTNVAKRVTNKPRFVSNEDVLHNVWTADEASRFLTTVKQTESAQFTALFGLALDAGMRKAELLGVKWEDIDLSTGSVHVKRQLLGREEEQLVFGLPKRGRTRTLDLSAETVTLLKEHKRLQAELKLKNRLQYVDNGLVFAQAWEQQTSRHSVLGGPLHKRAIDMKLERLCRTASVKEISVHGLRHTCATLLLAAGVAPNVVQRRLGHKNISITLDIYGHVLPSMQQDAAKRLASLLHG